MESRSRPTSSTFSIQNVTIKAENADPELVNVEAVFTAKALLRLGASEVAAADEIRAQLDLDPLHAEVAITAARLRHDRATPPTPWSSAEQ